MSETNDSELDQELLDKLKDEPAPEPEVKAETEAAPVAEAEPEPTPEPTPAPGTPNVALQKAQQKQSSIDDKLDALKAQIEAQSGKASAAQVKALEVLETRNAELKDEIESMTDDSYETDIIEDPKKLARGQVATRNRVADLERQVEALTAKSYWTEAFKAEHPKIADGKGIWNKACDAVPEALVVQMLTRTLGAKPTAQAVANLRQEMVSNIFWQRIADAEKAVEAKAPEPIPTPKTPTARKTPSLSPNGASVTVSGGKAVSSAVPKNADDEEMALVRENLSY